MKHSSHLPKFPKGFLFGAATSSHQVEGGNHNDWSEWELANAQRLADIAKPHWYFPPEAKTPENYISGIATDHYHRYEEDLDLAVAMGLNMYRFSLEWSRIEPTQGTYNQSEIEHYRNVIDACRKRGLEPFVTINHYTLPLWVRDLGGWESSAVVESYCAYAHHAVSQLGESVTFWTTFNEPEVYTALTYLPTPILKREDAWLDYPNGWLHFIRARRNIVKAHRRTYTRLKSVFPDAQIGISLNLVYYSAGGSLVSKIVRAILRRFTNHYFAQKTHQTVDWLGMQYYFRCEIKRGKPVLHGRYAAGCGPLLRWLSTFNKPIYITESGLDDRHDEHRTKYIHDTLKQVSLALAGGVDCRGYSHWSLTDNFEWTSGFWRRFGLVEIDYKNGLKRKPRPSAAAYAAMIKEATK